MFEHDLTEYAFKKGYREALEDLLKEEYITIEVVNKLLAVHHIDPFSN